MPRKPTGQPTEVEIDILHVLWDQGPSTLGAIHDAVAQRRQVAYSTTRKMVQVMRDKGLVRSSEQGKPLVYSAAKSKQKTQAGLVKDLAKRAFDGSAKDLMLSLISSQAISDDEMEEINRMIRTARNKS